METCQIREQRTPQKRRGAISAEVYTDEEVKGNLPPYIVKNCYLGGELCQKSNSERLQNNVRA